jgi:hypothetical protein
MKKQCDLDPRDFIKSKPLDAIFNLAEVMQVCNVCDRTAKVAIMNAFVENIVYPLCRRVGTEKWHVHLLAIAQLESDSTEFEVAFVRR